MSCCGQGRTALRVSQPAQVPKAPRVPRVAGSPIARTPGPGTPRTSVSLRYRGGAPIVVRGAVTGSAYAFSAGRRVQTVDARDVAGLLGKGLFSRIA